MVTVLLWVSLAVNCPILKYWASKKDGSSSLRTVKALDQPWIFYSPTPHPATEMNHREQNSCFPGWITENITSLPYNKPGA